MSTLTLNLNNQIITRDPEKVHEVDEYVFWLRYIKLITIKSNILSEREYEILAFILAGDPILSYFRGAAAKALDTHFNFSKQQRTNYKKKLVDKGFLQDTGIIKGDTLLNNNLRTIQKYIKDNKDDLEIEFKFLYNIAT